MKLPRLLFKEQKLEDILRQISDKDTIVIADDYNFEIIKDIDFERRDIIRIEKASKKEVEKVKKNTNYITIIGIGGCSALDFARACGKEGCNFCAIPSILSTACISVNKSILYENDHPIVKTTLSPKEVIISWPLITSTEASELKKWSASGFGDLFAKISAIVDFIYREGKISEDKITYTLIEEFISWNNLLNLLQILNWVNEKFETYDKDTLKKLAIWLYRVGLENILQNSTLSTAGEHQLYYKMQEQQKYDRRLPTHGQLVSIGTLITAKIIEKKAKEDILFKKLKRAYKKLGLPVTYKDLSNIHVEKNHIVAGIKAMEKQYFFLSTFFDEKLLDETYKE